jgi:hypothetical protein
MANQANNTVNIAGRALLKEGIATAQLTVGMHVTYAAGEIAAGGANSLTGMIVAEAPERGKGIFSDGPNLTLNTYAANEQVPFYTYAAGDEALILLATNQTITEGGLLEEAAAGLHQAQSAGTSMWIARESRTTTSATALIWAQRL